MILNFESCYKRNISGRLLGDYVVKRSNQDTTKKCSAIYKTGKKFDHKPCLSGVSKHELVPK